MILLKGRGAILLEKGPSGLKKGICFNFHLALKGVCDLEGEEGSLAFEESSSRYQN